MKRSLLIFAALAAWTACAQSARLGSLGRNDMVVTNIGEIARAASYGTDTQWTDATGCVWEVVSSDWVLNPATFDGQSIKLVFEYGGWAPYWLDGVQAGQTKGNLDSTNLTWTASEAAEALIATRRTAIPYTNYVGRLALTNDIPASVFADLTPATNYANHVGARVAVDATNYTDAVASDIRQDYIPINGAAITDVELFLNQPLYEQGQLRLETPGGESVNAESFVSSSQITNQGAVAAATAIAARKQDVLPYPTNAIPYAAISGAPSLAGQNFDFSRNYDIIRATAAIAEALGATVTNNPTAQGGN